MGTLSEDVSLCMTPCLAAALCYLKEVCGGYTSQHRKGGGISLKAQKIHTHGMHLITDIEKCDKKNTH